jgi:putative intracellular protease/amidase
MKRILIAIALFTYMISYAQETPKVLLFMRDAKTSGDLEYMLKREVGVMKDTLAKSGYKVVIATLNGLSVSAGTTTVKAAPSYPAPPEVSPEAIALVQKAVAAGKPVAAQTGSLWTLAEAGVLKAKKYAYAMEEKNPYFAGATFAGTGVVRDGLVITGGICPYMTLKAKEKDTTEPLSLALIEAMKKQR